jgi:hypothetical protein
MGVNMGRSPESVHDCSTNGKDDSEEQVEDQDVVEHSFET